MNLHYFINSVDERRKLRFLRKYGFPLMIDGSTGIFNSPSVKEEKMMVAVRQLLKPAGKRVVLFLFRQRFSFSLEKEKGCFEPRSTGILE